MEELKRIFEKHGIKVDDSDFSTPPDPKMGDMSCTIAFKMKGNPKENAEKIAEKIKPAGIIKKVRTIGPYINFFLDMNKYSEGIIKEVLRKKDRFGSSCESRKFLIDTFQPNTHKVFHIGHLRMAVFGESIRRILEFNGNKTTALSYMGDTGAHISKWLWYYANFYKGKLPKENFSRWAGEIYAKATQKLMENDDYKNEIEKIQVKLESGDKKLNELWKKTRELCLNDFWRIKKELDVHLDGNIYESEVEKNGKKIVMDLLKKGTAKESDGAVIMDLKPYNLGVFILLKSSGASLYATKDLGLADLKAKKYDYDVSLHIVASEQDFYFQQLFKTLELIKHKSAGKNVHVSFGLVMLEEGKMSSRLGNIVIYDDLKEKMMETAVKEIKKRNKNISDKKAKDTAEKIVFSAMKFGMLKVESNKRIVFNMEKMLDFEGETGPYLQYSAVRAKKILAKAKPFKVPEKLEISDETESNLVKKINELPAVVSEAGKKYKPNLIANYTFELAKSFNEFYVKCPVIKAEKKYKATRISLVKAFLTAITNCLYLLGIEVPEQM